MENLIDLSFIKTFAEKHLTKSWHKKCKIIPHYILRGCRGKENEDKEAMIEVSYDDGTEFCPCLRIADKDGFFSAPDSVTENGLFWDIYGTDFKTLENAIIALSKAPEPRSVAPITFSLRI